MTHKRAYGLHIYLYIYIYRFTYTHLIGISETGSGTWLLIFCCSVCPQGWRAPFTEPFERGPLLQRIHGVYFWQPPHMQIQAPALSYLDQNHQYDFAPRAPEEYLAHADSCPISDPDLIGSQRRKPLLCRTSFCLDKKSHCAL